MNYLKQIKGFWTSHEKHCYSTNELALYFYLLEIRNVIRESGNQFKRNNKKIEADLNISFNTLKNARNRLAQTGLIQFKTQNGNPNVIYTLSNFDEVSNEVRDEVRDEINKTKSKPKTKVIPPKPPVPPPAEPTWRESYDVYLQELRDAHDKLIADEQYIKQQSILNPGVDVKMSIKKCCINFWATEAGWKHKKKDKTKTTNDWKNTFNKAITMTSNKVYLPR